MYVHSRAITKEEKEKSQIKQGQIMSLIQIISEGLMTTSLLWAKHGNGPQTQGAVGNVYDMHQHEP